MNYRRWFCACPGKLVPARSLEKGTGRPGPYSAHPNPLQPRRGAPRTSPFPPSLPPPPSRRYCPMVSRLVFCFCMEKVSPDHSFLTTSRRGCNSSPEALPHPFFSPAPAPRLRSPPPHQETAGINFPRLRCGKQTPRSPRDPDPVDFGWTGGGGTEGGTGGRRFCCQTPSPAQLPQRQALRPGQTSRPRKQEEKKKKSQHPLNCKAKECTWAAEAPGPSCTPTSNKTRSWVTAPLRQNSALRLRLLPRSLSLSHRNRRLTGAAGDPGTSLPAARTAPGRGCRRH